MAEKVMSNPKASGLRSRFDLAGWLTLLVVISVLVFGVIDASYRHTLPTDGWAMGEAGDVTFLRDLASLNPQLQRGDILVSVEGIPVEFQSISESDLLQARVQAGNTLTYRIHRGDKELEIPVTIGHWPSGLNFWKAYLTPSEVFNLISTIVQFGLAIFIFFRKPDDPAAGSLLLIMAAFTSIAIVEVIPFGYVTWLDPTADFLQSRLANMLLMGLFPYSIIRFAMTFPKPNPSYLRFAWTPIAVGGVGFTLLLFFPDSPLSWFWFVLSFLSAVGILVHNAFTMHDAVSQAQIRWGVGGFVLGFGTLALMFLLNTIGIVMIPQEAFNVVGSWVFMVMVAMIAVAILRYRLFDIDIIIRKTLQYALLTGLLVLVYFGSVILLQSLTENLFGEQSPLVIVLSTLAIAALFNPLRIRTQDFIDRRFYRKKYDAEKALARFAAATRDEVELDLLTANLITVITETLEPEEISLWLK